MSSSPRLPSSQSNSSLVTRGLTSEQAALFTRHDLTPGTAQDSARLIVALPERARHARPPAGSGLPTDNEESAATTQPATTQASHNFGTGYIGEQNAMMYAREHMTGAQLYEFMMQIHDPKARGAFYATVAGGGSGQNDLQDYVLEHMFGGDTNARNQWINANCVGGSFSALQGIAVYFDPVRGPVQQKLVGWPS